MRNQTLRTLADEFWDVSMEANPTTATILGDHRFDDRIEDFSTDGQAEHRAKLASLLERTTAVNRDGLAADDLITYGQLVGELQDEIGMIDKRLVELASDQMTGFHVFLLQAVPVTSATDPDAARMVVERFRQVPAALERAAERFKEGAAVGRTPAAVCVARSLHMIEGYLSSSVNNDSVVTLAGPADWDGEGEWRSALRKVAEEHVRPAYRKLADQLGGDLMAQARDDEHCGLGWLEDGEELYAALVAHHTTVDVPPEEIHRIGLEEATEKLPAEYAEVGARLFGISDPAQVLERLRQDPSLRYRTGEEIMADARRCMGAATAAMGEWFGRLPQAPCAIEPVPEFLAADSPSAYYYPPPADGSRGGTYYVNTDRPENKARYETASIAFHEAIPGHHLQLAIANELTELPAFRRYSISNTAYVEGWALYAERLAEEMGLYEDDLERIGMLAGDSIRSCRLVVDTGLHTLGWSRSRAIEFMVANSPVSINEVTIEVDRYIGMPGQALAYKMGQREIHRLREDARTSLGGRFDIRGFHDAVLGSGAVRLPLLSDLVAAWVADEG